jgi:hypothetical protein
MLRFRISYPDLIKISYFADIRDKGAKAEERGGETEGDFMDNYDVGSKCTKKLLDTCELQSQTLKLVHRPVAIQSPIVDPLLIHVLELWSRVTPPECSLSSTNYAKILGQNQFDWPIATKKMKLWRLLKIKGYIVPPFGPTYIGESAKAYGLKVRCLYGEHVREHIVNLGNIVKTH